MREGVLRLNQQHRELLSNDLGAVGGLLFDIGSGRYAAPPATGDARREAEWLADLAKVREAARTKADVAREAGDRTHTASPRWGVTRTFTAVNGSIRTPSAQCQNGAEVIRVLDGSAGPGCGALKLERPLLPRRA